MWGLGPMSRGSTPRHPLPRTTTEEMSTMDQAQRDYDNLHWLNQWIDHTR